MASPATIPEGSIDRRGREPSLFVLMINTRIQMFSILPSPILLLLGSVFYGL